MNFHLINLKNNKKISFYEIKSIPCSKGVYAAWYKSSIIYVGKTSKKSNGGLFNRIKSHYSGQRGSNQFCLYIFDNYILNNYQFKGEGKKLSVEIRKTTRDWIRNNILFSFIVLNESENESILEKNLIKNISPLLNS